jgi:hypothetical protein
MFCGSIHVTRREECTAETKKQNLITRRIAENFRKG